MYRYDGFDHQFVRDRVEQFRGQVARRLTGALSDEEFRPLRLMNGLYLQLHAYMLRVAIPYGTLSARQMRGLADIAETHDRGYGHFTTRQNIQFNWPKLGDVPDILAALAEIEMHAIQTSGNCIRNITADPLAGVAADEIEDPRPTAELLRQWSSLHPEFAFLPRKFKIAVIGSARDRAAMLTHDIGLRLRRGADGAIGYQVAVGGGQGRTPMIAKTVREFLPKADLLPYLEAIMRVYNLFGRRDNKHKARIKILVHEIGIEAFREKAEEEFARLDGPSIAADPAEVRRIEAHFAPPDYAALPVQSAVLAQKKKLDPAFAAWVESNVAAHKAPGHAIVTVSLKPIGGVPGGAGRPHEKLGAKSAVGSFFGGAGAPGDASAAQMRTLAEAAARFSFDELRVTAEQNILLPHVRQDDLYPLWRALGAAGLDTANAGLITDIVSCPGLDYCNLATARSIPIAQTIARRFADPARQREIGPLSIKISGCINACGHHHLGHIGILGLEKTGAESYQVTLGGDPTETAAIGERLGPGLTAEEVVNTIERLVALYLARREPGESFLQAVRRLGVASFREALHAH